MLQRDYCLILCGDTPTSRSLTSAMLLGCIPIRVGSRLRGLCEPPCHEGWGWTLASEQYPHLPYWDIIPWNEFPEVDEQQFIDSGEQVLKTLFERYDTTQKAKIRSILQNVQTAWIYGWGDPVDSVEFGDAVIYIWNSFQDVLSKN